MPIKAALKRLLPPSILLLATILFWKVYVLDRFVIPGPLMYSDIYSQLYPKFIYSSMILRTGHVPLWDPYEYCGMPFLAIMQAQVFYPFRHIFFLIFSPPVAMQVFIGFHIFLNGLFAWMFFRALRLSTGASVIAALVWAFSAPLVLDSIYHPGRLSSIAWAPFCLLSLHMLLMKRKWRWSFLLAAGVAMQFLAGYPPIFLVTATILFLYFLFFLSSFLFSHEANKGKSLAKTILLLATSAGLWFLLTAAQLLPFLELLKESHRSAGVVNVLQLQTQFLLPLSKIFLKNAGNKSTVSPLFMGIPAFFLLAYGVILSKRPIRIFFVLAGFFTLIVALGNTTPVSPLLHAVPPFKYNRFPIMWFHLSFFFIAALIGFGIDSVKQGGSQGDKLENEKKRKPWNRQYTALVLLLMLSALVAIAGVGITEIITAAITVFLILSLLYVRQRWLIETLVICIGAIMFIVYVAQVAPLREYVRLPDMKVEQLRVATKNSAIANYLAQNKDARVYWSDLVSQGKYMYSGIPLVNGFEDSLRLRRTAKLMDLYRFLREVGSTDLSTFNRYPAFLNVMGVRLFLIPHNQADKFTALTDRYEALASENNSDAIINKQALPRSFLVHQVEIITDEESVFRAIRDNEIDLSKRVVLEEALPAHVNLHESFVDEPLPVISKYLPEEVVIEANPQAGAFLVLSDSYYPGWKAYDNGVETKIYSADYLCRAVYLEPGRHLVQFRYQPASYAWGARLSIVGGIIMTIALFIWATIFIRKLRHPEPGEFSSAQEDADEGKISV
jgi:hypothetical protein